LAVPKLRVATPRGGGKELERTEKKQLKTLISFVRSTVAVIKYRQKINVEQELHVAVSEM
jgi:hypothetical protein